MEKLIQFFKEVSLDMPNYGNGWLCSVHKDIYKRNPKEVEKTAAKFGFSLRKPEKDQMLYEFVKQKH